MKPSDTLRRNILQLTREYHQAKYGDKAPFRPGNDLVHYAGRVFDAEEMCNLIDSSLDFFLTAGRYSEQFEASFAEKLGLSNALLVNSGSSANLIALSTLTSPKLGARRLKPGDEVITVAAGFPTTLAPILQNNLIPVFVDVNLGDYTAIPSRVASAIGPKTRAIMMAHTLGNPFNLELIAKLAKKHNLWLIEDSCDALGGTYQGKNLGTFGDLTTFSFYPAHHITTGEGGAVLAKKALMKPILESFRDWGRDCWCASGCDNTCLKRYDWKLGELPEGFDHKYTYSHLGYNLKSGDIQAAIGLAQLERLDFFVSSRRHNWNYFLKGLSDLDEFLILPKATEGSNPSWFGFAMTVKKESPKSRNEIVQILNEKKIATRVLFGGNLLRQPAFIGTPRRVYGELINTDIVMNDTFWIGVWPGLTVPMLDYMIESITEILR